jgi:hypothetical protein
LCTYKKNETAANAHARAYHNALFNGAFPIPFTRLYIYGHTYAYYYAMFTG